MRRGQGLPQARHGQFCSGPMAGQLSPSAKLVAPLGKRALKKGQKTPEKEETRSEKHQREHQRVRGGAVAAALWQADISCSLQSAQTGTEQRFEKKEQQRETVRLTADTPPFPRPLHHWVTLVKRPSVTSFLTHALPISSPQPAEVGSRD